MIDTLNIILMLAACILGYLFPFELILFSYAFLGPAHYLTEISWLHDRGYFTTHKKDYLFLSVCTLSLLMIGFFTSSADQAFLGETVFLFILVCAFFMAFVKDKVVKSIGIFVATALLLLVSSAEITNLLYIFVPTLIHVYIFTGFFILFGALRSKSKLGILSLVYFIGCGAIYFIIPPEKYFLLNFEFVGEITYFSNLATETMRLFNLSENKEVFLSMMGFISFAYTYHYLNWFSKTKVIEWHRISKKRLAVIMAIYFSAIAIYLHNYQVGFIVLLYLSLLHVILELPLNFRTMRGLVFR